MLEKLKDGANKLKAKIGGDDLDEKLVEVVSEQNWQASTQQLHEVANAAYNYQKWQRINEFIWQKLKKSKSWKKILKTFNLIEFLLKNGPPSIISNFKYDLYQLRTFESYSNYVDGTDKGEPIRQRAKVVVGLLNNEELLEEERVKAKNIREKMSNVVGGSAYGSGGSSGGSNYGNNNGYGYGGSGKYDNYDTKKKPESNSYSYGNSNTGAFGDYTYNKSTLDKYKESKPQKNNSNDYKKQDKKPEIVVQTKKPFQKAAGKLSKPGQRKQQKIDQPKPVANQSNTNTSAETTSVKSGGGDIIDIFSSEPPKPVEKAQQPIVQQTYQPQPALQTPQHQIPQVQPQVTQQTQQIYQQPAYPQPTVNQPPVQQNLYQPQPPVQNAYQNNPQGAQFFNPQVPYGAPQQVPQQYPQQYPQLAYPNGYNQYPPQGNPMGQQFGYQQQFGQVQAQQQQNFNPYVNPMYPTTAPPVNSMNLNGNSNITLSTTAKKQQNFGGNSSSSNTAQNVNWLSNTEKGLIDFSNFGDQIKKQTKQNSKQQISNNIQIDAWSW